MSELEASQEIFLLKTSISDQDKLFEQEVELEGHHLEVVLKLDEETENESDSEQDFVQDEESESNQIEMDDFEFFKNFKYFYKDDFQDDKIVRPNGKLLNIPFIDESEFNKCTLTSALFDWTLDSEYTQYQTLQQKTCYLFQKFMENLENSKYSRGLVSASYLSSIKCAVDYGTPFDLNSISFCNLQKVVKSGGSWDYPKKHEPHSFSSFKNAQFGNMPKGMVQGIMAEQWTIHHFRENTNYRIFRSQKQICRDRFFRGKFDFIAQDRITKELVCGEVKHLQLLRDQFSLEDVVCRKRPVNFKKYPFYFVDGEPMIKTCSPVYHQLQCYLNTLLIDEGIVLYYGNVINNGNRGSGNIKVHRDPNYFKKMRKIVIQYFKFYVIPAIVQKMVDRAGKSTKDSPSWICRLCDICIDRKAILIREHRKSHLKCQMCHEKFEKMLDVWRHQFYTHDSMRSFKCLDCNRSFISKENLNSHRKIHLDDCPFVCRHPVLKTNGTAEYKVVECGLKFSWPSLLKTHQIFHTTVDEQDKWLECPIKNPNCYFVCLTSRSLKRHLENHVACSYGWKPYKHSTDILNEKIRCSRKFKAIQMHVDETSVKFEFYCPHPDCWFGDDNYHDIVLHSRNTAHVPTTRQWHEKKIANSSSPTRTRTKQRLSGGDLIIKREKYSKCKKAQQLQMSVVELGFKYYCPLSNCWFGDNLVPNVVNHKNHKFSKLEHDEKWKKLCDLESIQKRKQTRLRTLILQERFGRDRKEKEEGGGQFKFSYYCDVKGCWFGDRICTNVATHRFGVGKSINLSMKLVNSQLVPSNHRKWSKQKHDSSTKNLK